MRSIYFHCMKYPHWSIKKLVLREAMCGVNVRSINNLEGHVGGWNLCGSLPLCSNVSGQDVPLRPVGVNRGQGL